MNIHRYRPFDAAPLPYQTRRISYMEARQFIEKHHYMKGMSNAATGTFGLFDGAELIGVLAFATPCSERVRACVFGPEHVQRVTELHRLVIRDVTPPNAESFFIARCLNLLKELKPHLWAVVSFADSGAGHVGTIYQATNSLYYGPSRGKASFVDQTGRARSPRQCKVTVTREEALRRGWKVRPASPKHRYCFSLPDDKRHAKTLKSLLLLPDDLPYPKNPATMNRPLRLF